MMNRYDVVIIGAGPAGSSCALALRNSGLKVALIDKDKFPRNKTCGDAIPGLALKYLKEIFGEFIKEFDDFEHKHRIKSTHVLIPGSGKIEVDWELEAYNSKRFCFDNFLLDLVKKHSNTSIYEDISVNNISGNEEEITITAKGLDDAIRCNMLIGSDGANSIVSRTLNNNRSHKSNYAVAISTYYKNVSSPADANTIVLFKDITGYFWIFPVDGNSYNVGFGMYNSSNRFKSINIKKHFQEIINHHPVISQKFSDAKIISNIKGFRLPLAGNKINISGNRFLLTGDAAHLIDPLGGHGIDKAIKSGMLAAHQVEKCFRQNNFSSAFNAAYGDIVYKAIGKELSRKFNLMKLLSRFPRLVKFLYLSLKYYHNLLHILYLSNKKQLNTKYKVY